MKLTNAQIKIFSSLSSSAHARKKHSLCICEGIRCFRELLDNAPMLVNNVIFSENSQIPLDLLKIEHSMLPQREFSKISSTVTSQGILAIARIPTPDTSKPMTPFIPVLDKVSDPGNMGTIIRTAAAAGLRHIWLTKGSTDPYSDKAIRSAIAAQFRINIRVFESLDTLVRELRSQGFHNIFRTDCRKGTSIFSEPELFSNSAVVFGAEASGAGHIPDAKPVSIPMPGKCESLNVAQALTITAFEAVRRGILQ